MVKSVGRERREARYHPPTLAREEGRLPLERRAMAGASCRLKGVVWPCKWKHVTLQGRRGKYREE